MRLPTSWHLLSIATLIGAPAVASAQGPTIAFTSPTEINEGEAIPIEVSVTGTGTVTWSWDTDFDSTFGELPDTTMYTVPATDTDGNATVRIGVQGTDDTGTRSVYRNITVHNIEPTITSSPPTMAQVRREYRYEVVVDEPAGANDPIEYVLTSKPDGMTVTDGVITWTPTPAQRGDDFSVILRISDGDGGGDDQTWDIRVANNTRPTTPTPVSPIMRAQVSDTEPVTLTVENATDSDGDPLLYYFRLSRTATFDPGPDLIGSGEVSEGSDGMTTWTTAEPLAPGHWYWQVWVSDEIEETEPVYATLVVGDPANLPDAGTRPMFRDGEIIGADGGTGGGGGGCSVSAPGAAPASLVWLLSLGLGAIFFARRRR